jgi:solute carrier family 25 carnitine/acylcarnitine transporter 20/29
VGGASSVAVGQPFDTVKVRVQTLGGGSSAWRVAATTVREEGARALFKGMSAPLVMTGASNAIVFAAKGAVLRVIHPESELRGGIAAARPPPLWAVIISGNVAGARSIAIQRGCANKATTH